MTTEKKQGVVILSAVLLLIVLLALLADWQGSFAEATVVDFRGIPLDDCEESSPEHPYSSPHPYSWEQDSDGSAELKKVCNYKRYILQFRIRLLSAWVVLLPLLIYGVLRSLGILKPIFDFEQRLSKFIPQDKRPNVDES